MQQKDQLSVLYIILALLLLKKREQLLQPHDKRYYTPKQFGVRPILWARRKQGFYDNLLEEARLSDPYVFFNFTRMTPNSFDTLLGIVGPLLRKNSNREPISPGCRLAITLRFLASGDSYPSLSYSFRVGVTTICHIVRETCAILWSQLQPIVLSVPKTEDLKRISDLFSNKWSLPNCVGDIDGKHIIIQAPNNSGSLFYNYKKSFSIVILAICDADYNFTYVDIGSYGSQSDGGILQQSAFGKTLLENNLGLPELQELPYCRLNIKMPYFFVGDEAFPLRENLMRPYSKPRTGITPRDEKVFNCRLSRARRMIENTFGIMVARFRILHKVINALPETTYNIIKAIVCLHNFIRRENSPLYVQDGDVDREVEGNFIPGRWRIDIPGGGAVLENVPFRLGARNAAFPALAVRNHLKNYLNGPGSALAPWQWDIVDEQN